jgi:hypothetical protein
MTQRAKLKSIIAVCVAKCCLPSPHWTGICWYTLVRGLSIVKDVDKLLQQMEICIGKLNEDYKKHFKKEKKM